ncbi:MAG: MFS transporter [Deltaproteobacteria bacterium]|nr:MAG: MFS transporter [Deltaproteobacteria bacterium]
MPSIDKKIFATLFISIFATVTGVGIVVPLLPVYAHTLGAGGFGIGMIFGSFSLARTFFLPYFGRLSDRKGRKPLIVAGLFSYALISLAFVFSDTIEMLVTIRFLQGFASAMIMPVVQAYIGDITPPGREGFVMGLFNMSIFSGLSLGPLMGGIINDRFSLTATFFCMGVLSLGAFFACLFLLPPTGKERMTTDARDPERWWSILGDSTIAGIFFFRLVYTGCIGIIWGFLPVLADMDFSLSSTAIGFLVMEGVLIGGLMQMPMGYLADRLNRRRMIISGGLLIAVAIFSFVWATGFWGLFVSSLAFGIGGGIAMPAIMAIAVIKGNDVGAMGSVMAMLTVAHSLGMLAGSLLAGVMMDVFSLRYAFPLGGVLMAGCVLYLIIFPPMVKNVPVSVDAVSGDVP